MLMDNHLAFIVHVLRQRFHRDLARFDVIRHDAERDSGIKYDILEY